MARVEKRKVIRWIGLWGGPLLISIVLVFVIDSHFALDPWGDEDMELLWWFLLGCIFFPGAFRRYRAGRQTEPKVPWYHRLDLIGCLLGLVSGLAFAVSVVQKWMDFVFMNSAGSDHPPIPDSIVIALEVVGIMIDVCWLALAILLLYQRFKPIKQRKTAPPQTP